MYMKLFVFKFFKKLNVRDKTARQETPLDNWTDAKSIQISNRVGCRRFHV